MAGLLTCPKLQRKTGRRRTAVALGDSGNVDPCENQISPRRMDG
jgi:hypothetical protein